MKRSHDIPLNLLQVVEVKLPFERQDRLQKVEGEDLLEFFRVYSTTTGTVVSP
jgi:hypothetical protein